MPSLIHDAARRLILKTNLRLRPHDTFIAPLTLVASLLPPQPLFFLCLCGPIVFVSLSSPGVCIVTIGYPFPTLFVHSSTTVSVFNINTIHYRFLAVCWFYIHFWRASSFGNVFKLKPKRDYQQSRLLLLSFILKEIKIPSDLENCSFKTRKHTLPSIFHFNPLNSHNHSCDTQKSCQNPVIWWRISPAARHCCYNSLWSLLYLQCGVSPRMCTVLTPHNQPVLWVMSSHITYKMLDRRPLFYGFFFS